MERRMVPYMPMGGVRFMDWRSKFPFTAKKRPELTLLPEQLTQLARVCLDVQERAIDALYAKRGQPRPAYQGALPEGNDGLGLMLLGVSGDEVLPRETYEKIKAKTLSAVRGTVQADILKEELERLTREMNGEAVA